VPDKINKHKSSIDIAKAHNRPIIAIEKDTSIAPSLFRGNLLTVKNAKPEIHYGNYDYWVTGILLFLYILFVWMYVSNYKKLGQIIKGFYINRYSNQLSREELAIGNRVSVFLSIFFISTLTLFICRLLPFLGFHLFVFGSANIGILAIVLALLITATYCIKFAVIMIAGTIFQLQREANDYIMTIFLFCNTLGLFMFPLVLCLTFVKQVPPAVFIYAGLGIITIFLSVRIIKGIILGLNSSGISKIYLFMYLCTLEILPFIIMVKLFMLYVK